MARISPLPGTRNARRLWKDGPSPEDGKDVTSDIELTIEARRVFFVPHRRERDHAVAFP
jgi:hypothetical protein